jgi:Uma2 family endonuclease
MDMALGTTTKLTYEDYLHIPEDGRRHEIIDGEHFVNPAPNTKHQQILASLGTALYVFVRERKVGKVFFAPYDTVFSNIDVVQPDILFVSSARLDLINAANLKGAPDLAVEILSENRRYDEIIKKKLYERHGVLEYWIADPDLDSVKIYRRSGEGFAPAEILSVETGGTLTTPLLPGFSVPIEDVFAE